MPPSKTPNSKSISHRLVRKMVLQTVLIALVAILSIGTASVIIEQFLLKVALSGEATYFWNGYEQDPATNLPRTANLKAYLSDIDHNNVIQNMEVPQELRDYGLGYHKLHGQTSHSLLYVSERSGKRLFVLMDGSRIMRVAFFFGIMPLMIVLIMIYLTAWWIYRQSNSLLSPIIWLANKFDRFDPAHPSSSMKDLSEIPGDLDWEVEKLVKSLSSYSRRIKRLIERERRFTRGASHEFRTPLTVIKMASDMILAEKDLDEYIRKYAHRIRCSVRDMEELIDAFLILARETDKEFDDEAVTVAEIAKRELKIASSIYNKDKQIKVEVQENSNLVLQTAPKVLAIILGNLVRNAIIYTQEGSVTVVVNETNVQVRDTGKGMTEEQTQKIFHPYYRAEEDNEGKRQGYGLGLTIVQRLSSLFDWTIEVESELGKGSTFTLRFTEIESN